MFLNLILRITNLEKHRGHAFDKNQQVFWWEKVSAETRPHSKKCFYHVIRALSNKDIANNYNIQYFSNSFLLCP